MDEDKPRFLILFLTCKIMKKYKNCKIFSFKSQCWWNVIKFKLLYEVVEHIPQKYFNSKTG